MWIKSSPKKTGPFGPHAISPSRSDMPHSCTMRRASSVAETRSSAPPVDTSPSTRSSAARPPRRTANGVLGLGAGAELSLGHGHLLGGAEGEPVPDQGTTVEVAPTPRGLDEQIRQVQQQALDSAYALIGHFVGEQRVDLARLYEGAAAVLTRLLMSPGPSAAPPLT